MDLRPLSLDQLRAIYRSSLARDFPPDELMPWKRMEALTWEGAQTALGFFDGQDLAAYAVFIRNSAAALLNYFAVEPSRRNQGTGSQFLQMLKGYAVKEGLGYVIFEVEAPEAAATPQDAGLRRRRIDFYLRAGAQPTGVSSWLYGVDYRIMILPAHGQEGSSIRDQEVAASLEALYHIVVPKNLGRGRVFADVCRVRSAAKEHGQFSRELGRALTFLYRGRRKFMGESLKEYDFVGAMYMILLHVDRHPGASQDSIASHMYLEKCNVTRRTKKLEELGYLYRETDQSDRRQNKLYLTEKGKALAPVIRSRLGSWGDQVSAELTEEEKRTLLALLTKMTGQDKR